LKKKMGDGTHKTYGENLHLFILFNYIEITH
jgi:hypothetical protein